MQLASFSISGFRSLAEVTAIPVRSPTVLTGRNDSGKSSVLDALGFLLASQEVADSDFPNGVGGDDSSPPPDIIVTGQFALTLADQEATDLPAAVRIRRVATRGSRSAVYQVERDVPVDEPLRGLARKTIGELRDLADAYTVSPVGPRTSRESFLAPLAEFIASQPKCPGWEDAGEDVTSRLPAYLHRSGIEAANVNDAILGALRSTLREILARAEFRASVEKLQAEAESALQAAALGLCTAIQAGVDGISGVEVIPQVSFRDPVSSARLFASHDGQRIPFEQSGTGRRKQVIQAVWEWERQEVTRSGDPGRSVVIAYDEPDTSLDYARQRDFMDRAQAQCAPDGNVAMIIATHSVQIIDRVPIEDVVHLDRVGQETRMRRLPRDGTDDDLDTFASDLAEQLGLSTSSILFERCFLLVEGPSEKRAFPRLFHLATGVRLREAGIVIWESGNNTNALKLARYLTGMGKPVYVIVDKDSLRDQPKLFSERELNSNGIPTNRIDYLGDPSELEELFSDEQWTELANQHWPQRDGNPWTPGQFAALRSAGKFSKKASDLLSGGIGGSTAKPDLMARHAQRATSREDIPEKLADAFDRLLVAVRQP